MRTLLTCSGEHICGRLVSNRSHLFFFSNRRRHTISYGDWSSDVCSSDLDECNLPFIERDGLLSTSCLLDRAEMHGEERSRIERQQRRSRTILQGGAVNRDQSPMPPNALARCLIDGTPPDEWYALLNTMVFFWIDLERLRRQSRACRPWPQLVQELDAAPMLD